MDLCPGDIVLQMGESILRVCPEYLASRFVLRVYPGLSVLGSILRSVLWSVSGSICLSKYMLCVYGCPQRSEEGVQPSGARHL